nr:MAG TPA: hypothetical protein [Caudoviricetes sp.]
MRVLAIHILYIVSFPTDCPWAYNLSYTIILSSCHYALYLHYE